ncbi:MAG: carcinine hydrolase/isopenicillin-N N-acyltransferase family protein [Bacteroidales bacterium]|nr:carcinine hydrolase/isopenicillin-N N-acyltransferase family protein [Bacteroidales bacterium]
MKLRTILALALYVAAAASVISCEKNPVPGRDRCTTILHDNLFGIEYDDYDFDFCVEHFEKNMPPEPYPGCSEVRIGNFIGRNLDYYINRNACAVIRMNHTDEHLASVGIVGCCPEFTAELAKSGAYDPVYEYLPCRTCDGINEKGVYVGVNVMPTGETSFDRGNWNHNEWGHGAAFTNKGAEKTYCTLYLTRYILDHASSVSEAIGLINEVNWYEPINYPHEGEAQAFHWMISDGNRNYVVEFIDNKPVVTGARNIRQPSLGTIMTNFTNALFAKAIIQPHGIGYERYDVLRYSYSDTEESFKGMEELMKKVWYSNTYTREVGAADFWATELCTDIITSEYLYGNQNLWNDIHYCDVVKQFKDMWNDPAYWYVDDTPLWFTVHTSIYDIDNRRMEVLAHEGRGGQKQFSQFDLNSHFDKPLEHKPVK